MSTRLSFSSVIKKWTYTVPFLLLIIFFFSVRLSIYSFLKPAFGILDAYLIDQLLLFFIFAGFFILALLRKEVRLGIWSIFGFGLYTIFILVAQSEILERYFIKDDLFVMLPAMLRTESLDYRYTNQLDFFYYHFGAFTLLFKFFRFGSYYYNVFALTTMALSTVVFLKLLAYLNILNNFRGRFLIILITLIYVVSPSIMDSYMYLEHSVATGYIATSILLSTYFYLRFLKERKIIYFILSYILVLFLLKTAMARAGFWPICLITLETLYYQKLNKGKFYLVLQRIILLLIPFSLMAKTYLAPPVRSRLFEVDFNRFLDIDRIYLFFANLIPIIIPYQFLAPAYNSLRILIFGNVNAITTNFVLNNVLFISGAVVFLVINCILFILFRKKYKVKLIAFFWICSIASLLFYIILGNAFERGINVFDFSTIHYPTTPGSRYYPLPLIFFLTTFYLILSSILKTTQNKKRAILYSLICSLLVLTIWSNISFTQRVNRDANTGIIIYKRVAEGVLRVVPDNSEKKVLYSIGGTIKPVTFTGRGFPGFYSYETLSYIDNEQELVEYLRTNPISTKNFYAFYFDEKILAFEDKSEEARKEFTKYLRKD